MFFVSISFYCAVRIVAHNQSPYNEINPAIELLIMKNAFKNKYKQPPNIYKSNGIFSYLP